MLQEAKYSKEEKSVASIQPVISQSEYNIKANTQIIQENPAVERSNKPSIAIIQEESKVISGGENAIMPPTDLAISRLVQRADNQIPESQPIFSAKPGEQPSFGNLTK